MEANFGGPDSRPPGPSLPYLSKQLDRKNTHDSYCYLPPPLSDFRVARGRRGVGASRASTREHGNVIEAVRSIPEPVTATVYIPRGVPSLGAPKTRTRFPGFHPLLVARPTGDVHC